MADAQQQEPSNLRLESQSTTWPNATIAALIQQVLQWFEIAVERRDIEALMDDTRRLLNALSELQTIIANVISKADGKGLEDAVSLLKEMKEEVVRVCSDSKHFMNYIEKVSKGATLTTNEAAAAECITKTATRTTVVFLVKEGTEQFAKNTTKTVSCGIALGSFKISVFASKEGTKQVLKQSTKTAMAAAAPVGLVADLAQAGCEAKGHKKVGKCIGATGNAAAGAMMGAAFGPAGAAVGAIGGLLLWGAGELVGNAVEKAVSGGSDRATN